MKYLILSPLCISALLLLSNCAASSPQPKVIPVDEKKNGGKIDLVVGDELEISLQGNPTTGYEWMIDRMDTKALSLVNDPEYKSTGDALGASGQYFIRIKTLSPGDTTVRLVYRRSFDKKEVPPADEYEITLHITN
jgi:inhibitor of cysteine peptidase